MRQYVQACFCRRAKLATSPEVCARKLPEGAPAQPVVSSFLARALPDSLTAMVACKFECLRACREFRTWSHLILFQRSERDHAKRLRSVVHAWPVHPTTIRIRNIEVCSCDAIHPPRWPGVENSTTSVKCTGLRKIMRLTVTFENAQTCCSIQNAKLHPIHRLPPNYHVSMN